MPNTLAHIGVQGLTTRSLIKNADYKWILVGCIIPDVPWILLRLFSIVININLYDLRLYAVVQSSLFFCILFSFLLATFAKQYWRVFIILSVNSLFHLLFDALQTKWANGVNLFAPFNWKLVNFGLFWPESIFTYFFTAFGFVYFLIKSAQQKNTNPDLTYRPIPFVIFLSIYIIMPYFLLSGPENANNHFVKTLRSLETRAGQYIEIDRGGFKIENGKGKLITFAGESISVKGVMQKHLRSVSIQGTFISNNLIKVSNYHVHNIRFRDKASYIGLFFIALYWFRSIFISRNFMKK